MKKYWLIQAFIALSVLTIFLILLGYIPLTSKHIIEGNSMLPTYKKRESIRFLYRSPLSLKKDFKRGEIVKFIPSDRPKKSSISYIKRIIAIEKDKIEIKNGAIFLNNKQLKENYILNQDSTFIRPEDKLKENKLYTVPGNYLFVLGDNREVSNDSRSLGFVNINNVVGYMK